MNRALYRKYRSKTLSEVIGQEHITKTLANALKSGKVSHAYLFTGPRGVGKTSVARILAREVNKLPYEESTHLDIIEIDAASNRRIDEIRELRDKVHIAPSSAKYKVYIIDEVHMLTREAFNALLKTLEEPPEHAIFILATTEAHKVPETIISRTQRFTFKPIDEESAVKHLKSVAKKEKMSISENALRLIARHGNGSFRDSIGMLDQLAGLDAGKIDEEEVRVLLGVPDDTLLKRLLDAVTDGDVTNLFDTVASFREQGVAPSQLAKSLVERLRELLVTGNNRLPRQHTIKLMKELLPATGVAASYELIEIALLDSISDDSTTDTDTKPTVKSESNQDEEEFVATENEPAASAATEEVPARKEATNPDEWTSVLEAIKGKHNTLYGILRMAKAEISDSTLVLTFQFEFHRKQLQQNKHLDILQDITEKVLGRKHEITVKVNKNEHENPPDERENPQNNVLSSVSNIFGGAELLES